MWSTGGVAVSFLKSLPPFEVLSLAFLLIFFVTLPLIVRSIKDKSSDFSFKNCTLVFMGPPLQQTLYVLAYRFAPPAEIDIIIYVWPILSLFLMGIFLNFSIRFRHLISGLLGFGAVILLAYQGETPEGLSFGHFLALVAALLWSIYCVLLQKGLKVTLLIIGTAFGMGALLALPLHFKLEVFNIPTFLQGIVFLYYSIALSLGAYTLWAYALKKGNGVLLTAGAYSKPVLSIFLLITFGYAAYSNVLIMAMGMILLSCLLSSDSIIDALKNFLWKGYLNLLNRENRFASTSFPHGYILYK